MQSVTLEHSIPKWVPPPPPPWKWMSLGYLWQNHFYWAEALFLWTSNLVSFQAFEANTASTASVRPTQEEQSTTPPGKVVTISSRSPRCSRNPSALRSSKTFPSGSAPCSPGMFHGILISLVLCQDWTHGAAVYHPWSSGYSKGRGSPPLGMVSIGECRKGPSLCDKQREG